MNTKLILFKKSFWGRTAGVTLITMLLLAAMPVTAVFATTIGFFAPTTASSPGSGWSGATRSLTSNNSYATATRSSKQLKLATFNITSIPTGSTIDGIEVSVEGHTSATTGRQANDSQQNDNQVYSG